MTSLRRAVAVIGAAALAAALSPVASAQAPRQPALVKFVDPTPGEGAVVTVSNVTIRAFVASAPGQKLFVTVTGPVNITREVTATSACQEVKEAVSLPKNGSYQVAVTVPDVPVLIALDKCEDATDEPRKFSVAVPPKPPGGTTNAPPQATGSSPSAGGTAGAGSARRGGSYSASGSSKSVFSGPPQPGAGAGASAAASEEGFDERLPYAAGEEEEPRELGVNETSNSSHRSLAFVAGGLLVLAVYMHLWWLKRQAEQPLSA